MVDLQALSRMTEHEKIELLERLGAGEHSDESATQVYAALIHDPSPEVRKLAVSGVWELPDPQHIEPLMKLAESDPEVEVRARAASVLGIYIHEGVVTMNLPQREFIRVRQFLLKLVKNPKEELIVRRMALEALSFDTEEDIAELIEWAYNHPDREMKMSAIFAMGRSSSERWIPRIVEELDNKDREIKLEAIGAAGDAFVEEATPKLRQLALSNDRDIRLQAIWALARTRGPGALEVLELCETDPDQEIAEAASEAIEEYRQYEQEEMEEDEELDDEEKWGESEEESDEE